MEITGGMLLLVLAIGARVVDVHRRRQRKAVEQRLATDLGALLQKRQG
jgi:hypothetical protein